MNIQTAIDELRSMDAQYMHGNSVLTEITMAIEELRKDRYMLLLAVQMAYKKHHIGLVEIGWDQVSKTLHNTLCESMGENGYQEWILSMRGAEREILF